MEIEKMLASVPVDQWQTKQAVVLDWHDGPREGICSLQQPGGEFFFELLDERPNEDDQDDRLFRLLEIPAGSVAATVAILRDLGMSTTPVWAPIWRFANPKQQQAAEDHLQTLRARARPMSLVICTRDVVHFLGCWNTDVRRNGVTDWFAALEVPVYQPQ